MTLTPKDSKALEIFYTTGFCKSQIWFYSFSSSFLTSENRHVSPKGTIKDVFFQNLKGMVSRLCVQQATLINGTHPACHC